jgi:hypothetical protein
LRKTGAGIGDLSTEYRDLSGKVLPGAAAFNVHPPEAVPADPVWMWGLLSTRGDTAIWNRHART